MTPLYTVRDKDLKTIFATDYPALAVRKLFEYVATQDFAHFITYSSRRLKIEEVHHINRFNDPMVVIRTYGYRPRFVAALIGLSREEYIKHSPIEQQKRRLEQLVEKYNA